MYRIRIRYKTERESRLAVVIRGEIRLGKGSKGRVEEVECRGLVEILKRVGFSCGVYMELESLYEECGEYSGIIKGVIRGIDIGESIEEEDIVSTNYIKIGIY